MTTTTSELITLLPLDSIIPGNNDRTQFKENDLKDLAESIKQHGLIQPITVRWLADRQKHEIIAGERRYRAHEIAKLTHIKAIVIDASNEEAAALMLAENVGRLDLDPIDEGAAYQSRIDAYGWTVDQLAKKVGVTAVRVQFRLKLLKLRPELQHLVKSGNLAIGYAQTLADGDLDNNRQLIAIRKLLSNPSPNQPWFRTVIAELACQQAQQPMFDLSLFTVELEAEIDEEPTEPPHPSTDKPAAVAGLPTMEILSSHAQYWRAAADQWQTLGKSFKRNECIAAAIALETALAQLDFLG